MADLILLYDKSRDMPKICQNTHFDATGRQDVLARFPRVMGHGHGFHTHIADTKRFVAIDWMSTGQSAEFGATESPRVR